MLHCVSYQQMSLRWLPYWVLLMICGGLSCNRGTIDPGVDAGTFDVRIIRIEGGVMPGDLYRPGDQTPSDYLQKIDLTVREQDPCTYGKCGKNLICMANVCKKKCAATDCNEKTSQCKANQACFWASTFTGACLDTSAKYLQKCGSGIYCEQGTLCVQVGSKQPRCLKLCKYGCNGKPCAKLDQLNCTVCLE